jgi:hypothetical protein
MPQFNTFAIQDDSAGDTSTFAGSAVPTLRVSAVPSHWDAQKTNALEGFASSVGSQIKLPTTSSNALTCLDASGSALSGWPKANPAAVVATYDNWYGFWMNDDATLLYVVLVEVGSTPDTFALVTINVAGTVVTLGTDQPSSDFTTASFWASDAATIQPDGTGFKLLNAYDDATNAQFAIIDIAGQFTTDPTALYTDAALSMSADPIYETADGFLIGGAKQNTDSSDIEIEIHNKTDNIVTTLPLGSVRGLGTTSGGFMRWRDYVVFWEASGVGRQGLLKSSVSDADTFAKQLAAYVGV